LAPPTYATGKQTEPVYTGYGSAHLRSLRYAHASGQNRIKGREDSHLDRGSQTVHVVRH